MRGPTALLQLLSLFQYVPGAFGQTCYYGRGSKGPSHLVPCNSTGLSACCLLGDTCLSGNACFNYATKNTYQYGCTDVNYEDDSCPGKCGWGSSRSPWVGLDFCNDVSGVSNTWNCLSPESCACEWRDSYELQVLPNRSCAAMGSDARVALYAPSTLLPYVSLPSTLGGSTGYYSQSTLSDGAVTVLSTTVPGYTPTPFTQFTTYQALGDSVIVINPSATPFPSSAHAAASPLSGSLPPPPSSSTSSHAVQSSPSISSAPTISHSTSSLSSTSVSHHASQSSSVAGAGNGNSPSNTHTSSGLSTGAKIGIGVGVGVGVVLLLVAIGVCLWRRKKAEPQIEPAPPEYPHSPSMALYAHPHEPKWAPAQSHDSSSYAAAPPVIPEKDGVPVNYSPSLSPPHSPPQAYQLSADQRRYAPDHNLFFSVPEVDHRGM